MRRTAGYVWDKVSFSKVMLLQQLKSRITGSNSDVTYVGMHTGTTGLQARCMPS
jgi:hypothetical protein